MTVNVAISEAVLNHLVEVYVRRAESALPIAAEMVRVEVVKNAERGIGADGHTFAPYTPAYAKRRQKMGLRVSPPNLRVSGDLLDTMEIRGGRLSVAPLQLKKAQGVFAKRPVFGGFSEKLRAAISRLLSDKLSGR